MRNGIWGRWPQLAVFCRDIPIFINSFNRLACLQRLVTWLHAHHHRRIHIIDNASTYPPLLAYYRDVERVGLRVIRLGENVGSRALWERDILGVTGVDGEYIYTDSDVVPALFCPGDAIAHLRGVLTANPEVQKVGRLSTPRPDRSRGLREKTVSGRSAGPIPVRPRTACASPGSGRSARARRRPR